MFKFLFKSKFLGFVEAPVGVFKFEMENWRSKIENVLRLEFRKEIGNPKLKKGIESGRLNLKSKFQ